jgi:hypothetical protein
MKEESGKREGERETTLSGAKEGRLIRPVWLQRAKV